MFLKLMLNIVEVPGNGLVLISQVAAQVATEVTPYTQT